MIYHLGITVIMGMLTHLQIILKMKIVSDHIISSKNHPNLSLKWVGSK